jgi:hypothetical protein
LHPLLAADGIVNVYVEHDELAPDFLDILSHVLHQYI